MNSRKTGQLFSFEELRDFIILGLSLLARCGGVLQKE